MQAIEECRSTGCDHTQRCTRRTIHHTRTDIVDPNGSRRARPASDTEIFRSLPGYARRARNGKRWHRT